jgi:hypothetical protein
VYLEYRLEELRLEGGYAVLARRYVCMRITVAAACRFADANYLAQPFLFDPGLRGYTALRPTLCSLRTTGTTPVVRTEAMPLDPVWLVSDEDPRPVAPTFRRVDDG